MLTLFCWYTDWNCKHTLPYIPATAASRFRDGQAHLLEAVVQAQLYLTFRGANGGNLTEAAIGNSIIRVPVTRDVESVKEIGPKTDSMLVPDVEILKERHIDLAVAGTALGAVGSTAKSEVACGTVGAGPIINVLGTRCC